MNKPNNYHRYETVAIGLFKIPSDTYGPNGWDLPGLLSIIGEDDMCYITEIRTTTLKLIGNKLSSVNCDPWTVGIHKSRLIEWKNIQLTLF